jgi:hypothetical protein
MDSVTNIHASAISSTIVDNKKSNFIMLVMLFDKRS